MPQVVVGLDLYLKRTHGTVMTLDGRVVRQERFSTTREDLKRFLAGLPRGTEVGLESLGFCWPWIDLIEELGHKPLLGDPIKLKHRAEDARTDRIDSEFIATLLRMRWFPAVYVPNKELRQLRSLLRHRVFRRRISTALKNRTWSEFRKRDIQLDVNLGTKRGRSIASSTRIYEVAQNLELLEVVEAQMKQIEAKLEKRYGELEPIRLLRTIPDRIHHGFDPLRGDLRYQEVLDPRQTRALCRTSFARAAVWRTHEIWKRDHEQPMAQVGAHRGGLVPHQLVPKRLARQSFLGCLSAQAEQDEGDQDRCAEARERGVGGLDLWERIHDDPGQSVREDLSTDLRL